MSLGVHPSSLNGGVLNDALHLSPAGGAIGPSTVSTATSSTWYAVSKANGRAGVNVSSEMPVCVNVPAVAGVILRFAAGLADPTASRSTIGDASSITTEVGTTLSDAISWIITGDSAFAVSAARFGGASAPFAAAAFAAPSFAALPAPAGASLA